jgi:hypothetical protein
MAEISLLTGSLQPGAINGSQGRSWRRGRTRFSRPDEATAVILDRVWVAVQEFILECLQVVAVQTELQLEGAIGHAASALEHSQGLVQDLLESHRRPSTPPLSSCQGADLGAEPA